MGLYLYFSDWIEYLVAPIATWTRQLERGVFANAVSQIPDYIQILFKIPPPLLAIAYAIITVMLLERERGRARTLLTMIFVALIGAMCFVGKPLLLAGSAYIIIAAFVVRSIPASVRAGVAALQQIDPSIEEASSILGADAQYTFRRVTLPLILPALLAGLIFSFTPPHDQPVGDHLPGQRALAHHYGDYSQRVGAGWHQHRRRLYDRHHRCRPRCHRPVVRHHRPHSAWSRRRRPDARSITMYLILDDLYKKFASRGGVGEVTAVEGVSLQIAQGELVTLLGPSGCGKTTTLRLIAGFEFPTQGRIILDGKPINDLPPHKRDMSMVFQSYAIFPHLNVSENVAYGLNVQHRPASEIKERLARVLELVGLTGYENRAPNQLSGGQQQRVALARALVMEPKVLLMDEPLSNLDAKLREQMRTEIRRIQKRLGITSVYVTHDQSEAMTLSDRICIINKGRIEQVGSPVQIYQQPANTFVADFIGRGQLPGRTR